MTDFDVVVPAGGPGPALLGSCHTVPFPPEVNYAFVSASVTKGTALINVVYDDSEQSQAVRADSPLYNLDNPGCSGNLIVPLRKSPNQGAVAVITFFNNSHDDGVITVIAGASVARADKQPAVHVFRALPAQQATVVHILFSSPS